jgi:alpha-glutamyl/putrescinyl thymine pyrophosphorylase clade 1
MNTSQLVYWITERERIRVLRESGAPSPWTTDPILRDWSFCCVRREHDRVTQWVTQNWREPHKADPDLWFAMAVARFVNWPDTLQELGYPVPWDREHFITVLQARARRGWKVWGPAYNISNGGKSVSKAEYVAGVLDGLWKSHEALRPKPGERLAEYHGRLRRCNGLADFMAGQILADVKFAEPLRSASDWMVFAAPGPGSMRGINRVLGLPLDKKWDADAWRAALRRLHAAILPDLQRIGLGDLSASDLQSCLCELDKYERLRLGEGKPKRKFVPSGGGPPAAIGAQLSLAL